MVKKMSLELLLKINPRMRRRFRIRSEIWIDVSTGTLFASVLFTSILQLFCLYLFPRSGLVSFQRDAWEDAVLTLFIRSKDVFC